MKKSILFGMAFSLIIFGCEDKKADQENDIIDESVKEFTSVNIKTNGPEFFTFSENKGATTEPTSWDLSFAVVDYQPSPMAPVIKDPVIIIGNGKSATKIEAKSLADFQSMPAASTFKVDKDGYYTTQGWYDYNPTNHVISPKDYIYAIKLDDKKDVLFEITDYYDDNGTSGSLTIQWKYLAK